MQGVIKKILDMMAEEREYAYADFEKYVNEYSPCLDSEYDDFFHRGLERAERLIKEVAEQHNNGWIPCSERLPEKKGKYLTTSKIYFVPDHVDEPDNYIGLEITYYSEINGWNGEVIAWQPLPEPYQPTRENCSNRHENGNCLAVGGFCTSVDDKYCKYHKKKTNFDMCCESIEAMAQIIDIAKIGWTKDQIMEWLQKEECEVPAPYQPNGE